MDNYSQLVGRISVLSRLGIEEIERRVEAKRAKLSGLVSKEGAAQIVAAELDINFDLEKLKIAQIVHGMKKVNVTGKVIEVSQVREFAKNGREGKVVRLIIADDTSNISVVLWDTHHISLIEKNEIKDGSVIEISRGQARNGELHLSSFSDVKLSSDKMDNVVVGKQYNEKKLADVVVGEKIKTRAVIVQAFAPRSFVVCEKCGKKVVEGKCGEHGNVEGKKRAALGLVLDDGSENIRGVLFGEQVFKLGLSNEEIFLGKFNEEILLGEEKFFAGSIRNNDFSQSKEMIVEDVDNVDAGELIKKLEAKM